ncbi:MAG TPA: glutathionylspermidine synthase family protein [Stellaceae bacterium]|nr:glutathionylspermidine synthase family protein [Stellaceae bacterium]
MERLSGIERTDWRRQAAAVGFDFAYADAQPYWDESVYYRFTLAEIEGDIEAASEELLAMCYQAVGYTLDRPALLRQLAIPEWAWDYLRESWRRQDKDLYGRFDLHYDGRSPPKLFEFNADTPTALFEAAVFQWQWLEQNLAQSVLPTGADQFNSIHEKLIAAFANFGFGHRTLHVACLRDHPEDLLTAEYLRDCANQAGIKTKALAIADIGIAAGARFTDLDDELITDLFKLYPWEWMLADEFGRSLPQDMMRLIEPPWKMTLSNKGLLAILWDMFPGHRLLLPAYFEGDPRAATLRGQVVRKPLLGREGSNIEIARNFAAATRAASQANAGPYGEEGFIVQEFRELPAFAGNRPVIGSWVVAGQACGMGIREEASLITSNVARFVPHIILN